MGRLLHRLGRRLKQQSGFTLIELTTALALFGVIVPAITGVLSSSMHWSDDVQEGAVVQMEMRSAIDKLSSDLRQAYTGDSTPIVEQATATTLVFYSPDRATPFRLRKIAYRLAGGSLDLSTTTSTNTGSAPWTFPAAPGPYRRQVKGVLSAGVFTYLDANGAATTNPASIRQVAIAVTVASGKRQDRPFVYQTSVELRASA